MKALFLFPPEKIEQTVVARAMKGLEYKFPNASTAFGASSASIERHSADHPDRKFLIYENDDLTTFDIVVFLQTESGSRLVGERIDHNRARVYYANPFGILRYGRPIMDSIENPYRDTHIFNRILGDSGFERFSIFPNSYLYRIPNLGPTDEFGFRVAADIEKIANREPEHKVIAVFGGSAAWSTLSLFDEMFTEILAARLNSYCKSQGIPFTFTVLNYAQPHGLVLNEMITFLLWGFRAKPDLVISHSGVNDFSSGQMSDNHLLSKYDMTYQFYFESWAKILAGNPMIALTAETSGQMPTLNAPHSITKAYLARLAQFEKVVAAYGAKFLHGLQPFSLSKSAYSPKERRLLSEIEKTSPYIGLTKHLPFLYEKFIQVRSEYVDHPMINFHTKFFQFGESETVFGDHIHTLPDGDQAIGEIYFDYLKKNFLPVWMASNSKG